MKSLKIRHPVVRRSVSTLFEELSHSKVASYEKWSTLLWESSGVDPKPWLPLHDGIAKAYGMTVSNGSVEGGKLLFAIQTFFAAMVKHAVKRQIGLELSDPFFEWTQFDFSPPIRDRRRNEGVDVFGPVYQNLYPAAARKALGEFYTPDRLAEFLFRQIDCPGEPLLDPACGSGVFLLAAIRHLRERNVDTETILSNIRGFDLNPLAVLMAKANLALTLEIEDETKIPVFRRDSILDIPEPEEAERFNIVGNPPWLNWDRLPKDYREKTRPLWEHYGLFNLSGNQARHGGAKKELAQLMILRVADRYLKPGGRLAMVLPIGIFQTRQAGEGFRRFRLPADTPLGILRVDDLSTLPRNPFANVGTKAGTVLLEKGRETAYPVPLLRWRNDFGSHAEECRAAPIRPDKPTSPWIICPKTKSEIRNRGPSDYRAFLGANSGGANGVFWLEILGPSDRSDRLIRVRNCPQNGKLRLPCIEAEVETELVYPLLRWGDVDRSRIKTPSCHILLPQDTDRRTGIPVPVMEEKYPETLRYLERFEPQLRGRAAFRKYQAEAPFYSMYNVGPQTVAPLKVVWRRMDKMLRAVVVESWDHPLLGRKPVVPQETCVLIPCRSRDEADYLAKILNDDRTDAIVQSVAAIGSKGFGSPGILDYLGIRRFSR